MRLGVCQGEKWEGKTSREGNSKPSQGNERLWGPIGHGGFGDIKEFPQRRIKFISCVGGRRPVKG